MLAISEIPCGIALEGVASGASRQALADAKLIESTPFTDLRGCFEVAWSSMELTAIGITFLPESSAFSYNRQARTLRGMHFQEAPYCQTKIVSCIRGRVFDVVADLRSESPTYLRWAATELSACSGRAIYIPAGLAHGFLTLTDHATLAYLIQGNYIPDASGVLRWDDPILGIRWPCSQPILSERDRLAPDWVP